MKNMTNFKIYSFVSLLATSGYSIIFSINNLITNNHFMGQ
jgi:hypothetical protein